MRLTNEQIAKYQSIFFETFGEPISREDALVQGLALLRLVKNIAQPTTNEKENNNEPTKQIT